MVDKPATPLVPEPARRSDPATFSGRAEQSLVFLQTLVTYLSQVVDFVDERGDQAHAAVLSGDLPDMSDKEGSALVVAPGGVLGFFDLMDALADIAWEIDQLEQGQLDLSENLTLTGMLISRRIGHEKIRLIGAPGDNPIISFYGSEAQRGLLQAYDDHMAFRVYKPDGTLISLRAYDDGRITWDGKKLLTEDDRTPDRVDEFAPFPAANARVSVLHGYGQAPSEIRAWAVCVNASGGYAPGDRIKLGSHYRYQVGGMAFGVNDTEIFYSSKYLDIINQAGGGTIGMSGSADWKLEIQSWM